MSSVTALSDQVHVGYGTLPSDQVHVGYGTSTRECSLYDIYFHIEFVTVS